MPSRSVVTRENLSDDFEIDPENPSGALKVNIGAGLSRNPETGAIDADAGGWPGLSADVGNVAETRDDGLYVPAGSVAISEANGNLIRPESDGIYAGAPSWSGDISEAEIRGVSPADCSTMMFLTLADQVSVGTGVQYPEGGEVTIVRQGGPFTISFPSGTTCNGIAGPVVFTVEALPAGVVLKNIDGADQWIAMGNITEVV